MDYLAIKDLKKTKVVRERLEQERELIVTKDGTPFALLVGISPGEVEEAVREIRRALFSAAVVRARRRAAGRAPTAGEIEKEIKASRAERGLR